MNDGRYFYQKMFLPSSIIGTYTFKTSDDKYHVINYSLLKQFIVDEYNEKTPTIEFKLEGN